MGIEEYLAGLFADILEDIIVQTLGDSAAEKFKNIFSPDKRKRKRALIQAFKSAIENTIEISPELKEALDNREFATNLLKNVLIGDFERIRELAKNSEISDIDDFVRDFERELRLRDEFREIVTEIRKIRDLDRIAENTEALKKHLVGEDAEKLLNDYFETIEERFGYLDLKGFSPRIGRKEIVKIPVGKIFIPLKFEKEVKIDSGKRILEEIKKYYDEELEEEVRKKIFEKSIAKIINMADLLKYDRCVILGDPGSGKTTLLKNLAYEMKSYIPIYARITDYSEKMSQFSDLYTFVVNSDSKYKNLFKWAIENGKALILLDGLDEVIDTAQRMKVSDEIQKLTSGFLNNKYIVTSRLIGYESVRLAGFEHFTIQPFEMKDIKDFAKRWYRAIAEKSDKDFKVAEKSANELIEAIFRNKNIERLATNPLLMTITALIHYRGNKLPNRRVELYQVCVETMLESWVLQRIPSEEYLKDKEALIEILSPVAFYIHGTSIRSILATKPNSDLAYFETSSMNTDIVEYIRAVKNSDLPEDSKLLAMGRGGPIIVGVGPKLTIEDFEKIVNTFRNELDVLYSITVRLGYPFRQNKLSAHEIPKTDDPVIILLISDILNEKPDEGIIKECIDIFREEKNNKNKRVLFSMLYHFLTPFSGLMSSIMSSKMTYGLEIKGIRKECE
ncbi:MAG: AAA family ATPase [Methanophagales archaeon]|nr:AAA family ATPase [Methanophagales archaeon]